MLFSDGRQARPTSKKKRHLLLAVASGYRHVTYPICLLLSRWPPYWKRYIKKPDKKADKNDQELDILGDNSVESFVGSQADMVSIYIFIHKNAFYI